MARNKGGSESMRKKINAVTQLKHGLPLKLAGTAQTFFVRRFRDGAWYDQNLQKWKERKNKDQGRAILVKTGNLRKSIHIVFATWRKIRIESGLPYAAIHNYGLTGMAFGKHKFKMPQRKFMGNSYQLRKLIREQLEKNINEALRK